MEKKITAVQTGGLWFGKIDGVQVVGPYLNKGMAVRQARRIANQHVSLIKTAVPTRGSGVSFDARAEGLPGHAPGLADNDMITLHSLFAILTDSSWSAAQVRQAETGRTGRYGS